MTVADVMLYGKVYQWAVSQMYNEIPVRLVPCGCGADVDEHCMFKQGRGVIPHADRRDAAQRWKRANPEEYETFKLELIEYYVKLAIKEVKA